MDEFPTVHTAWPGGVNLLITEGSFPHSNGVNVPQFQIVWRITVVAVAENDAHGSVHV